MASRISKLFLAAFGGLAFASISASAATSQGAAKAPDAAPDKPSPAEAQWVFKSAHGKWGIVCNAIISNECRAVQNLSFADGTTPKRQIQIVLLSKNGKVFAAITFPLGVDLRAGTALQIGDAEELTSPYAACLPNGCQAYFEINDSQISKMQQTASMKIGFRPWGGEKKTYVLEASLDKIGEVIAALKGK